MCHLHGGFLLTKVTKQVRARGGGAEATPEKDATGSPESSPASSGKVQYGLSKFFGSASQKKEAQPVPLHLQLQPYKRQRLGRFQEDAIREKNEALRQQAEFEASQATNEPELIEAAQKRQKYGIRKDALKNILSKEGHWEILSNLWLRRISKARTNISSARGNEPQELAERFHSQTSSQK